MCERTQIYHATSLLQQIPALWIRDIILQMTAEVEVTIRVVILWTQSVLTASLFQYVCWTLRVNEFRMNTSGNEVAMRAVKLWARSVLTSSAF
jgi:hypothetical protein